VSIARLVHDVEHSRARLMGFLEPLDRERAHRPIGAGRWSPVQYLEHLVRAEEATVWRMFKAVEDERWGERGPRSDTPHETIDEVVERTWAGPVESPPLAVPEWGGAMLYWLERMQRNADILKRFAEFVAVDELDVVAYNHPISGPFTLRQGVAFVGFHIDRHHAHLREALEHGGRAR